MIKITDDLFDIACRLKSVKETYVVYYNKGANRYEVHDTSQRGSTFAFVVPFEELDSRTVDYALKTRVQNAEKLFAEIEADNAKLEKRALDRQVDKAMCEFDKRRFYDSRQRN